MAAQKLTQRERDLIERALQNIEADPKELNMDIWGPGDIRWNFSNEDPDCGTAMCFAGHLCAVAGVDEFPAIAARGILKSLTRYECDSLFYKSNWPKQFYLRFRQAKTDRNHWLMASILRERIEHFLLTGE